MDLVTSERLERAFQTALASLLAERHPEGYWPGELSTSALSTATAVSALALEQKHSPALNAHGPLIAGGVAWLDNHQNADGGWGDTVKSLSNISTTMLCRAAFHLTGTASQHADCLGRANQYMERFGKTSPEQAEAVRARYGKDRTFAGPILTTCALAGLVEWKEVQSLPFELACLPQAWYRFFRLHVVSYALPALIAIGQAVYHHRPPWNPVTRLVRWLARRRCLRVLQAIQPSTGGFLEATPLTSFVTLSLASIEQADHPVARRGVEFLVRSVRPDGSWPIDTNLATWVTTLAVNALAAADQLKGLEQLPRLRDWLLQQQYQERHPYTGADPGGWAWTDLPGGVPDGDDTPGALLALANMPRPDEGDTFDAAWAGLEWLLGLQNRDGGMPTFCRGWGNLPFDRSGVDLTAHALRAFAAWGNLLHSQAGHNWEVFRGWRDELGCFRSVEGAIKHKCRRLEKVAARALTFLKAEQRPDGSWLPLWFGNQNAPDDENPTYGTARVLAAYRDLDKMDTEPARRGIAWLLAAQNPDGGWGGVAGVPSSIEETALAVEVLLGCEDARTARTVNKGLAWLVEQVEAGGLQDPTPIGFYFAKLWYYEKLYPIIFTVAALGSARRKLSRRPDPAHRDIAPS
jgi:squalene-hopene/tetraprenyl-beta-curcumene cyclase